MASAASYTALGETEPQIHHLIKIPEEIEPAVPDQCCIYKVPVNLRKLNVDAYTPQLISIGPFHHNNQQLQPMEKQKQRYFQAFWKRLSSKQALVNYKAFLEENKEKICNSYSEPVLCNDQFVDMILLDSVFIMELFLRKSHESERNNDYMFTTSWVCKSVQRDLLLLENQLPIFVLEELYRMVFLEDNQKEDPINFLKFAILYFEDYYPHKSSASREIYKVKNRKSSKHFADLTTDIIKNCKSSKHFTDLIRYFYLPAEVQVKVLKKPSEDIVPKTATKLNEAGITFEKVQNKSLLDIELKTTPILSWFLCLGCLPYFKCFEARLQIPQLKVDQITECVLRNLIALEQCHYSNQPFICSYVSLIDSLIHTQEDVELLVDKEVIVHELGSHTELATLVNGLCKHVVLSSTFNGKIIMELNEHYNSRWKHNMGMLRSVYFRDPWRLSSTVVGAAIFLFAVVNFLRVIRVIHPNY